MFSHRRSAVSVLDSQSSSQQRGRFQWRHAPANHNYNLRHLNALLERQLHQADTFASPVGPLMQGKFLTLMGSYSSQRRNTCTLRAQVLFRIQGIRLVGARSLGTLVGNCTAAERTLDGSLGLFFTARGLARSTSHMIPTHTNNGSSGQFVLQDLRNLAPVDARTVNDTVTFHIIRCIRHSLIVGLLKIRSSTSIPG